MADLERIDTENVAEDVNNEGAEVTEETYEVEEEVSMPVPQKKKSKAGLIFGGVAGAGLGFGLYKLMLEPKLKARKLRKAQELLEANGATVIMPEVVETDDDYDGNCADCEYASEESEEE